MDRTMDATTVEILEESAPAATDPKPRPKLRTRRRAASASAGDADSLMADAPAPAEPMDETVEDSDVELVLDRSTAPSRRGRPRDPDVEDAYEPPADDMEDDDEEEEDEDATESSDSADFAGDRRRSTRTRRPVQAPPMADTNDSEEEAELVIRGVSSTSKRKPISATSRRNTASASRKRPRSAVSSKRASESRRQRRRKADDDDFEDDHEEDDDDEGEEDEEEEVARPARVSRSKRGKKSQSNDDGDEDEEDWMMPVEYGAGKSGLDEEDENVFIIDKILARDVLSRKEWRRRGQGHTTRFLQNGSIFLDEEEEQDAPAKKTTDTAVVDVITIDNDTGDEAGSDVNVNNVEATHSTASEPSATEEKTASEDDSSSKSTEQARDSTEEDEREEERFLIKWKRLSYVHVSWETEKNLHDVDKNARGKIQRFREKEALGLLGGNRFQGDEYFNPEFREVDRILDIQDRPGDDFSPADEEEWIQNEDGTRRQAKYFLVKWKAQAYDEITWEREDDIQDDAAVEQYKQRLVRATQRYLRLSLSSNRSNASKTGRRGKAQFRGYSASNPPPFKAGSRGLELRDYQLTGVNWMLFNWYQRRNSMLADEMGLGKTVQTVTYVNHLAVVEELPGPYLIVAPLSTLGHWQREFTNWTTLNAVVYHGNSDARKLIQEFEFSLTPQEIERGEELDNQNSIRNRSRPSRSPNGFYRFDVLITTFEMCSTPDFARLGRVKWQLLVVDEAHRLKNRSSKLSVTIRKNFTYENILLLTGTPLQNNIEELWTLLNFLDPERFDSMDDFLTSYGELKDSSQVETLHSELRPFLLRRMKEDVEKSLAPKEETIIEVELTVLQKQYYRAIFEQNTEFLARGMKRAHAPSLMNVLMELRKCCNHPFLIKGVEQRESLKIQDQADLSLEEKTQQITELLVTSSGKLVLLDKLLPRLKENGHRVLIFSQFKIMLDILQDYLRLRAYRCERIDGNITGNDRQAAIDRFCDPESSAFIMLLSTRAGGVGINLTAADTVIIYDSDWNPQNDLQAQARCHRIGQKKSVKIYRLLTAKTYELHMFHQASLKLGLDQAVLGSIRNSTDGPKRTSTRGNSAMSKDEIEGLLKHGAYEMFKEEREGEAEAASKRFSEESIDHILSRSTKIIHDPSTSTDSNESSKRSLMSSFSKATFVSSTNPDEQVALDDPDFWTKVVGLEAVDPSAKVDQSPLRKRRCRRQVKSYLQEDSDEEGKMSKKSRSKRTDVDNEEFVISSDDDDDDDDDETDELDDDDFVDGAKKKKSALPSIRIFKDRVTDLLTSLGYGEWQDMIKHSPALSKYPLDELQSLCHSILTRLVRTAAAPFISSKLQQRYKANSEQNPPIMTVVTPAERATLLDNFANKFRFVHSMLANMGVSRLSSIPFSEQITPSLKAERDAATRLAQIDRMFTLQVLVRSHIGPSSGMISLCREYQKLVEGGKVTKEHVLKLVKDGKLPDEIDIAGATKPSDEDGTPQPSPAIIDKRGEEGAATNSVQKSPSDANTGMTSDTPNSGEQAAEEDASSTSTVVVTESVQAGLNENMEKSGEMKDDDSPKSTQVDTPANENTPKPTDKETQSNSNSAPGAASSPSDVAATPQPGPTVAEPKTSAPVATKAALKVAMRRLQGLPDIGDGESVCPWWLPLVDDIMLLLFVVKNGWIRARSAPPEFARANSVFGARAAAHPVESWPSGPVLNRRIKTLIAAWTNERRVRTHVLEMEKKRLADLAANAVSPDKATRVGKPSGPPPQQHTNAFSAPRQSTPPPPQQHSQPPSTNDYASVSYIHAKRNRFAKLIHAFGIPDTRLCRTDSEIRDKWRYFLDDELLRIQHVFRTELHAEATDLEYCCRIAIGQSDQALTNYVVQASHQASILGGRRGFWRLSGTQCRRLIHRIDIFRMLRTHILVMPPKHLLDVVDRVVAQIRLTATSLLEIPPWWRSPAHDVLLMQGVEFYGLDEYLPRVWELPMFAACLSGENTSAPASTWVENYVSLLAKRCYAVVRRARENHKLEEQQKSEKRKFEVEERRRREVRAMRDEDPNARVAVRIRMIDDTREFEEAERAKNAKAKAQENLAPELIPAPSVTASIAQQEPEVIDPADVVEDATPTPDQVEAPNSTNGPEIQREDSPSDSTAALDDTAIPEPSAPCETVPVAETARKEDSTTSGAVDESAHEARSSWQTGVAFLQAVKAKLTKTASVLTARQETQSDGGDRTASQRDESNEAPDNSARELTIALREIREMKTEDPYFSKRVRDVWLEQVVIPRKPVERPAMSSLPETGPKKASGPIDQWVSSASMTTPPPRTARKRRAASISSQSGGADVSTSASHGTAGGTGAVTDLTGSGDDGSATTTTASTQEQPTASGQKRKRAPRSWEVIVIDDSDDDENHELVIAKRTTRSRRRQRGESLSDGLH